MKIPFLNLEPVHASLRTEMEQAFRSVYDRNWFILGEELTAFEQSYADFSEIKFAIGVSNGLDALFLCLKALGIGPGDEVIVPSNTFIASFLAVSYTGATPVPVEPDIRTYNLNPENIEQAITQNTRAVMPVHLYGQACEMDKIAEIAKKHDLFVIEDNAQAHGARFKGQITGSWGIANGTSFYPGKNLGALGDGGAVTTDEESIAKKICILRNYGSEEKYTHLVAGQNMRLDELQAAFLTIKLRNLNLWNEQRQRIAGQYNEMLAGSGDLILPFVLPDATHVYHLYVVRTAQRNPLQQHLSRNGIGSLIHYPTPPHLQKAYERLNVKPGQLPVAEEISKTCLSLPLWPGMTEQEVEEVIKAIKRYF